MSDDFIEDLLTSFNSMTLSEKTKVTNIVKTVNKIETHVDKYDESDINSLISDFSQLDLTCSPSVINKFYLFILKLVQRDRKINNTMLFVPPEPPMCK